MKLRYTVLILTTFLVLSCQQKSTEKDSANSGEATTGNVEQVKRSKAEVHPGKKVYDQYCKVCHQENGQGISGVFPPLTPNEYVRDEKQFIDIVLNGKRGGVEIDGKNYNGVMLPHNQLTNEQISDVISYVRSSFGNNLEVVSPQDVEAAR